MLLQQPILLNVIKANINILGVKPGWMPPIHTLIENSFLIPISPFLRVLVSISIIQIGNCCCCFGEFDEKLRSYVLRHMIF